MAAPTLTITTPANNSNGNVGPLSGAEYPVCVVAGTVDPGDDGNGNPSTVGTIYLAAKTGSDPVSGDTEDVIEWVRNNFSDSFTPSGTSWSRSQTVRTTDQTGPHRMMGIVDVIPYDSMNYIPPGLADANVWTGVAVAQCPAYAPCPPTQNPVVMQQSQSNPTTAPAAVSAAPPIDIDVMPISYCDGWMRYTLFDRNNLKGNRLCVPGPCGRPTPLKAAHILLAAAHILWKPTAESHHVLQHPCGIPEIDGTARMRFPNLAKYSVVLFQSHMKSVITSECREHPQQLALDPRSNIFVQLNTVVLPPAASEVGKKVGAIEIWIKPVC